MVEIPRKKSDLDALLRMSQIGRDKGGTEKDVHSEGRLDKGLEGGR